MSVDGTYSFAYCGELGVGVGVITIRNDILKGADLAGGRYSGTVSELPNAGYRVVFDMIIPADVFLVQGASPQEMSHKRSDVILELQPDFDNGEPIKLFVPPGNLTFMIRKISDDFAWYASGVKVTITPIQLAASTFALAGI
jgi:hypothetical protein